MINRPALFAVVRAHPFGGRMIQPQIDGVNAILDGWEARKELTDLHWLAYMLGTAFHETAQTMQPIREYGRGHGKPYGEIYYGRGYVQLTWHANYLKAGEALGLDLVAEPDLALQPDNAARILFWGMTTGAFTGKRLSDYFDARRADWIDARKIINGLDRAEDIAAYARAFDVALRA